MDTSSDDDIGFHYHDDAYVTQAIDNKDPDYLDEHNALWFPPGAPLLVNTYAIPPHLCYANVQTMLVDETDNTITPVIVPDPDGGPHPCDHYMENTECHEWVQKLVEYPSYLLFTYNDCDRQDFIQQHRGHTVRELVPKCSVHRAVRLNLPQIGKMN